MKNIYLICLIYFATYLTVYGSPEPDRLLNNNDDNRDALNGQMASDLYLDFYEEFEHVPVGIFVRKAPILAPPGESLDDIENFNKISCVMHPILEYIEVSELDILSSTNKNMQEKYGFYSKFGQWRRKINSYNIETKKGLFLVHEDLHVLRQNNDMIVRLNNFDFLGKNNPKKFIEAINMIFRNLTIEDYSHDELCKLLNIKIFSPKNDLNDKLSSLFLELIVERCLYREARKIVVGLGLYHVRKKIKLEPYNIDDIKVKLRSLFSKEMKYHTFEKAQSIVKDLILSTGLILKVENIFSEKISNKVIPLVTIMARETLNEYYEANLNEASKYHIQYFIGYFVRSATLLIGTSSLVLSMTDEFNEIKTELIQIIKDTTDQNDLENILIEFRNSEELEKNISIRRIF